MIKSRKKKRNKLKITHDPSLQEVEEILNRKKRKKFNRKNYPIQLL
tara:strand:- start:179 stop:316 length:138 start_codon:yes stop_codon:yes gene_type:complete